MSTTANERVQAHHADIIALGQELVAKGCQRQMMAGLLENFHRNAVCNLARNNRDAAEAFDKLAVPHLLRLTGAIRSKGIGVVHGFAFDPVS